MQGREKRSRDEKEELGKGENKASKGVKKGGRVKKTGKSET